MGVLVIRLVSGCAELVITRLCFRFGLIVLLCTLDVTCFCVSGNSLTFLLVLYVGRKG